MSANSQPEWRTLLGRKIYFQVRDTPRCAQHIAWRSSCYNSLYRTSAPDLSESQSLSLPSLISPPPSPGPSSTPSPSLHDIAAPLRPSHETSSIQPSVSESSDPSAAQSSMAAFFAFCAAQWPMPVPAVTLHRSVSLPPSTHSRSCQGDRSPLGLYQNYALFWRRQCVAAGMGRILRVVNDWAVKII
jgi:hypothetical protein